MIDIKSLKKLFVADGRIERIEVTDQAVVVEFVDAFESKFRLHFENIRSMRVGQCVGTSLLGFKAQQKNGELMLEFFDDDDESLEVTLSPDESSVHVELRAS
jgi:hypothetical protein